MIIRASSKHDQLGIVNGRKPCRRLACHISSMLNMVSPHSCTFHPSKPCNIPAIRQTLITLLDSQFCSIIKHLNITKGKNETWFCDDVV